ncbi:S-adenosyl-L-methionine-dependent methyltransferase [Zopfia rhizophila CBS 207.26]|uniref:S-adenosyl-L-methionine-dependent methyltransferase n=1 Tax=Zopfia rhizophila CBS 207.26 TaxID=1314779 RepID=A0A6A6DVA5_9PEZI|nr:S-adenosyl-L-methionine-dependent methyltransferase [Zopfia rhizophila CBS 207.26]
MVDNQALYDRPNFFQAYLTLPRSQNGLEGAPEWPTLREMVGNITDQRVLDLGCGLGWFSRYASNSGAHSVDTSDISAKMLGRAKEMNETHQKINIRYELKDLATVKLTTEEYDLAYSSLVLHYLANDAFGRLLREVLNR